MPRFFFDIDECGTVLKDDEGQIFADTAAARDGAVAAARWIMAEEIREGRLCLSCSIRIADQRGRAVGCLGFREAVTVTGL